MQVVNYHDWSERSLNYLCRLFNNLNKGDDYSTTLPAIQIGILDFTPFPENPSFYSKNLMMDTETHHVYSSKFAIHVLDLKQINNASSEDKHWGLDNWARLFKATTWEDVSVKKPYMVVFHTANLYLRSKFASYRNILQAHRIFVSCAFFELKL